MIIIAIDMNLTFPEINFKLIDFYLGCLVVGGCLMLGCYCAVCKKIKSHHKTLPLQNL